MEQYSWALTLKGLCSSILDMDKVSTLKMKDVLIWMELQKAQEELDYISFQEQKNKMKLK